MHFLTHHIPQSIKNVFHFVKAVIAAVWFGFPARKVAVIGVTGTDGKTTTVQMISAILREAGYHLAIASTINFRIGEREWVNTTKFTTLSAFGLQRFLAEAARSGCTHAVVEISSHSLDQNRIWSIHPFISVITNVTREHLDYHKTMKAYRAAKKKLLLVSKNIAVNAEMECPDEFLDVPASRKIAYSTHNSHTSLTCVDKVLVASDITLSETGSDFSLDGTAFHLLLPGKFNIENALAAVSVALLAGVTLETSARALSGMTGVPGRMEYVPNNKGLRILIDYAVTPDALTKLYTLIQKINQEQKNIIAVFGACGDRDRGKRPLMGEIVSRYANAIILTNEDPYFEDPNQIIDELKSGIVDKKFDGKLLVIFDRKEAVQKALEMAQEGDFVIITGKGAEETMAVREKRVPWNDKKTVLEIIGENVRKS